ncbi:MAG: HAD family hydrolase [Roseovarius sp.]|nr:HAD family hydrolase [Roseovarius sp.]
MNSGRYRVDGLLFDKDGTLFDFHATWSAWAYEVIRELSSDESLLMADLARSMHYDLGERRFLPDSPVIAGTGRQTAECVCDALPESEIEEIERYLLDTSLNAPLKPTVDLASYFKALSGMGLSLGVMTNDAEAAAISQLDYFGVSKYFDFIAGFDSGYGAKPEPDPLLAFAEAVDLQPEKVAMVGDSTHDLIAGKAAGMQTIAVLTGAATVEDLMPYSDVVLSDIGHIPCWLIE